MNNSDFRHYLLNVVLTGTMMLAGVMASHADDKTTVTIKYDGSKATVANKVKGVSVTTDGAHVTVDNSLTDKEVEFVLSGKSDNGQFIYNGTYKTTVSLKGLHLHSTNGAAINLKCGKRMKVNIEAGTSNYLEDGPDTLHKACLYTKGHLELEGGGTLSVVSHSKSGIAAKEYVEVKKSMGKIDITSDTGNGINSGSTLTILGGELNINLSSVDKKGLKSDSTMTLSDCHLTIRMTGDGGKGIKCGGDLVVNDAKIDIITSGNFVSEASGWGMGGFGGMMGGFGGFGGSDDEEGLDGEMPDFGGGFGGGFGGPGGGFGGPRGGFGGPRGEMNDSTMQRTMEEGRKRFEEMMASGEMPDFGGFGGPGGGFGGFGGRGNNIEISDSIRRLLFADSDNEERGMGFAKRKYNGSAKAVKVEGSVVINGGDIRLETQSAGAEGLEGKQGITINGGKLHIESQDDGMNSGGKIVFNGGNTFVWSKGNDAIDSNSRGAGAITISGGSVISCSQTGSPEEAFDCDFSPLLLTGGTVFGMGGSMGGEATAPSDGGDTQPTVVLSGLPCPKGKVMVVTDKRGKELFSFEFPFTMQQSSSILSLPEFKKGETFSVKIKNPDVTLKQFTFDGTIAR